jgi:hypothetical protein
MDVGARRSRPLSKRLRPHQSSWGLNCSRLALPAPGLQRALGLQVSRSPELAASRVRCSVQSSVLALWGRSAAAPQTLRLMLQPPLTLPSGSPWDPCMERTAVHVREQSNNYVIERGRLICPAQTPRDSHEGTVSRPPWGSSRSRGQHDRARNASFHHTRDALDSANATGAARKHGKMCMGWRLSSAARISTKLRAPRFTRLGACCRNAGG